MIKEEYKKKEKFQLLEIQLEWKIHKKDTTLALE